MSAIIQTGGKQYLVSEGDTLKVEKLELDEGEELEFDRVLCYKGENGLRIGRPYLEDVRVTGRVLKHDRHRKITVLKYKAKKRYRKKTGRRQPYSEVLIESIVENNTQEGSDE